MKNDSDEENRQNQHQDHKNPIKRAEKEKEFRTVGQINEIFKDPSQIYQSINKYSNTIKKVLNQHPTQKKFNIIDFSLNARGPDEDSIYVKHSFYRKNIRRGNTILYDTNKKQAYWARKGLMKFFDISMTSLEAIVNENIVSLSKRDQYSHYAVFTQVENVLSCNDELDEKHKAKVHIYRLNKANGQNAQVSYFKPTDEWVISSKNVSILVKSPDDFKHYTGDRYQFSKLIAECWFKMIKEKNKAEIEKLKEVLNGRTIVGEYCGNPEFQHLVKYADIIIYFYAVVQNESAYSCIPPLDGFKIFEENQLPIVKNYEKSHFGTYTNFVELGKDLVNLFSEVSRSSIFQDEQGSVIYFVLQKSKVFCEFVSDRYLQKSVHIPQNWQSRQVWFNVASLGKLKTLEYRILRKLRQKLRSFTRIKKGGKQDNEKKQNDNKKFQQKYGKFQKQCYQLLRKQKLNKPIEYYFCVSLIAFDYVFKNRKSSKNLELLNDHYLDFLSIVFWCVENKKEVTAGLMTEWKLIQQLRTQNWQNYSIEIVNDYEKLLETIVPKYAFIRKKLKIGQVDQDENQQKNQLEEQDY